MAKILLVILGRQKPSSRLRIFPIVDALRGLGHEVELLECPVRTFDRLQLFRAACGSELVLLQKKLFHPFYVSLLAKFAPRLIYDVDDAVMFHELERGESVTGKYFMRFAHTVRHSHLVVVGNRYLSEFACAVRQDGEKKVMILPTSVDTRKIIVRSPQIHISKKNTLVIGWIGTKGNLAQLVPLKEVFQELGREFSNLLLRIVSNGELSFSGVRVDAKPWNAEDELSDLHSFDVGIMPLADNLWNRGKGGYKLLQYMAAGLPVVASPVGINCEIIDHGVNGYLAASAEQWHDYLRDLLSDSALRVRMGAAARETIESRYSLDGYREKYLTLIENALQ